VSPDESYTLFKYVEIELQHKSMAVLNMGNLVYLSIVLLLCVSKGMYIRRDKLRSYLEATGVVVFHLSVRGFCFEFK
jgi:hypothetical protein